MATMKDVAKRAGVSHGTVSNVINGVESVSIDKVRRVEAAMRELDYEPNAVARSLKMSNSKQFDVILPNIAADSLSYIYSCISSVAAREGYTANLYITNDDKYIETNFLNHVLTYNKPGVIIMTCQPENTELFKKMKDRGLKLVFIERKPNEGKFDFVGLDKSKSVERCVKELIAAGKKRISVMAGPAEFSCDKEYVQACKRAVTDSGLSFDRSNVGATMFSRESALKVAFDLLGSKELPDVVLTMESVYKDAMIKAIGMSCRENAPLIVSNAPNMWDHTDGHTVRYLPLHYGKLANAAVKRMIEVIENRESEEKQITVEAEYIDNSIDTPILSQKQKKSLRLLMMDNAACTALERLVPGFERQTGCRVEIVKRPYSGIYEALCKQKGTDEFDILSIDIPWVREFAEEGEIEPLGKYLKKEDIFSDIPKDILEVYAKCGNEIYGYPYNFCIQLLFYRKDFFADIKCRSLYYEMYKRELRPPRTWKEFNDVARFFTRQYNPYSPTEYGTTLGACLSSGATCEFLPRLWGMGGSISENGRFTLDSKTAVAALENYVDSFKYAPGGSENNWWPEQAEDYRDGKAAMMMLFADNTYSITEYDKSQTIGKTGYALLPDKASTLGGWVLSINSRSRNKKLALEFMKWSISKNISLVGTVLGGFVPTRTCLESTEITNIYPWTEKLMEGMEYSRQRKLPEGNAGRPLTEPEFEAILGKAVYDAVTREKAPAEALNEANIKLNELLSRA